MDASTTAPANQTSVSAQRALQRQEAQLPQQDQKVDMFSLRGFQLANRIAQAFSTSDAVPASFRNFNLKKVNGQEQWIENTSALGNCIVAIEVAQAVGMSIAAVMQNANVIEGRLSWSGKFVIAAINASGRFTPLRFDIKNKGLIKATYKEKQGWNSELRRYNFKDVTVEVENLECIAWALPAGVAIPNNVRTLDQAKTANLPVIESAPVSMKMAVEEGWYGKSGSKWQTEMKHLMLQYRAGSFFGNIHAPDIVMGMGRTSEELVDLNTIDVTPLPAAETAAQAPAPAPATEAQVVGQVNSAEHDDHPPEGASADAAQQQQQQDAPAVTFAEVADKIAKAQSGDELAIARDLSRSVQDAEQRKELDVKADAREKELAKPAAPKSRRAAQPTNVE